MVGHNEILGIIMVAIIISCYHARYTLVNLDGENREPTDKNNMRITKGTNS